MKNKAEEFQTMLIQWLSWRRKVVGKHEHKGRGDLATSWRYYRLLTMPIGPRAYLNTIINEGHHQQVEDGVK